MMLECEKNTNTWTIYDPNTWLCSNKQLFVLDIKTGTDVVWYYM